MKTVRCPVTHPNEWLYKIAVRRAFGRVLVEDRVMAAAWFAELLQALHETQKAMRECLLLTAEFVRSSVFF